MHVASHPRPCSRTTGLLPRRTVAVGHSTTSWSNQYFDSADVTSEVAGVAIRLGKCGWRDVRIVLGSFARVMAQPGLQLEESNRFLGVVQLAGDGGALGACNRSEHPSRVG